MPQGFCELCQMKRDTRIITGVEVCCIHVTENAWDQGMTSRELWIEKEYGRK